MNGFELNSHSCRIHGKPTKRQSCRECNAAYMRSYLRRRRLKMPDRSLWDRAKKRSIDRGLEFGLPKGSIIVPRTCPVLGIPIELRGKRSHCSPSLDRIAPEKGYVTGNIRVISDRANRLKSNHTLGNLRRLAESGRIGLRNDYAMVATYVEREQLLLEVRQKAAQVGRAGEEWAKVAAFLDRIFRNSLTRQKGE
jgi:hypothetical protein